MGGGRSRTRTQINEVHYAEPFMDQEQPAWLVCKLAGTYLGLRLTRRSMTRSRGTRVIMAREAGCLAIADQVQGYIKAYGQNKGERS